MAWHGIGIRCGKNKIGEQTANLAGAVSCGFLILIVEAGYPDVWWS